jgi:hypothetical protein
MTNFFDTTACTSRGHCLKCRDKEGGRRWRQSLAKAFETPEDPDFECPHGVVWFAPGRGWIVPAKRTVKQTANAAGPGTELQRLIFQVTKLMPLITCNCGSRIAQMNAWGPDGCLENVEIIVGWLQSEAKKHKMVAPEFAVRRMIKLAIARARRKEVRRGQATTSAETQVRPG